jgi:hypothetical protein
MEIKDARSLPSIAQEDLRQKAIKAVMDGKKQVEIAEILDVPCQAVGKYPRCRNINYLLLPLIALFQSVLSG